MLLKLAFDQETGFPCGDDTERWVSLFWQGLSLTTLAPDEAAYRSFRVPYGVLAAATSNFSEACCIGGGASCAVYKASVYSTRVAVKALNSRAEGDEGSESKQAKSEARQFAAEMALLTSVQHPNICRLLGVSTDGDRQCLVLEYCPGGALDKRLRRDRELLESGQVASLGWKQRLQIAVGIARALAHLHSLTPAMIHRDVKTQNVLLLREHCGDWVANTKVADFGTVREDVRVRVDSDVSTDVTGNQKSHGVTKTIIGTRAYMPGEYTLGRVGPKTDAFAFGIVLIELLTSRGGVGARTLVELSDLSLQDALASHPEALRAGWPKAALGALAGVAARCVYPFASRRSMIVAEMAALETMLTHAAAGV
jgi:serine/threonine protein kinase